MGMGSGAMAWRGKADVKQPFKLVRKTRSSQNQEYQERLRVAERIMQALHEAGYSCDPGDAPPRNRLPKS